MKKILILALALSVLSVSLFAQSSKIPTTVEKNPENWTDLSYQNIPILKILDGKDAFVVIYQKNKVGVGSVVIPKTWTKGNPENPRKLKFRNTKNPNNSFMTIVKKGDEFKRVILTIPMSKRNSMWGLVDYSVPLEGTDKTDLNDLEL